ncbi:FecR family protein [Pseudozobellia thermophila]|uniref:FecR family protein n=2 Tax=Pseudozobellia thermophila TaxID=192903 RepID=A0A1M6LFG9_9FLAO|nr:FecR family protein [Pseudozobellia thermophila]
MACTILIFWVLSCECHFFIQTIMNAKAAKKLFKRYLKNECTPEEIALLDRFLESYQDKEVFLSEFKNGEGLKKDVWLKIESRIASSKSKGFNLYGFFKYAAIFIGVLGLVLLFDYLGQAERTDLIMDDDAIVIKTGDNATKQILLGGKETITDANGNLLASQNDNQLVYHQRELDELVYNEIIIPKGKTFQVVLSDGTLVHLNAGSSLKYPVSFSPSEERKVFLEGEAYFEVFKDDEHRFTVVADKMEVQVLGTHFNVSSYQNETAYTVLAEGSVALSLMDGGDRPIILKPGQKAALEGEAVKVSQVDVKDYMDWRSGSLTFKNEPFSTIVKKIERRYNVTVENTYKELDSIRFRGTFGNETIEDLLNTFKESAGFEYEISTNKILIKKP